MEKDSIPKSVEGMRPGNGMPGQVPVVTIPNEVFRKDTHEMGQMNVSRGDSCLLSELIFSQG